MSSTAWRGTLNWRRTGVILSLGSADVWTMRGWLSEYRDNVCWIGQITNVHCTVVIMTYRLHTCRAAVIMDVNRPRWRQAPEDTNCSWERDISSPSAHDSINIIILQQMTSTDNNDSIVGWFMGLSVKVRVKGAECGQGDEVFHRTRKSETWQCSGKYHSCQYVAVTDRLSTSMLFLRALFEALYCSSSVNNVSVEIKRVGLTF